MKRTNYLLTACLLLWPALYGQVLAQDAALFYEITGKNLPAPSYLFGTFHLICPTDLTLTEGTRRAFAQTQQLYLELDVDDTTVMAQMQQAILLPAGKSVRDYLVREEYDLLDTYLRSSVGLGLDQLGSVKPLGLISMVYVSMLRCEPASYDLTLAQLAADTHKEVLGLEPLSDQLNALDRKPLSTQYNELVDMVRNPKQAQAEFNELLAAYKTGDLTKLSDLMKASKYAGDLKELEDNLLNARNANWIPVIERAASTKPTFFAFGAAHLMGENGVVALLRRQGYTVLGIYECKMEPVKK
ncbi:TraB/GumN family protein [Fibrella aestuarina]|uniref:TraB/GumN family protein n=1 Tax=Fibrella aestuarina TaxID=651143 RepID=UPI0003146776|nr:TraB/GumN family protein [Fibrella aestuarina]